MIVDALLPGDLPRCAELEAQLFAGDSPWPLAGFVSELAAEHNHYFALRTAPGQPIDGYAGIAVLGPAGAPECEVHTIAVAPEYRGRGGGRALLAALLEVADAVAAPVFLEVRTDNTVAIALYQSAGFSVAGLRPNYYRPSGADAYTMVRAAQPTSRQEDRP
ncbi:putative ribosomal-protein-alanine acetyltransferase [Gordonia hirsuta DSM 44140 = NBRC 16056]|uniref:Putative ribosomal-protein-alanine acetyltransferase n=1 Tax=Gordonia hirsuta DSM 44140 = NBRC 16056 TaxID=1121927 RepID=L7L645_9ACTN|nr:ribosomal protein S18-alanine N-acetyltransferase [Gordonia hirsuta]GAC56615.1 putative ribosomal-protein-alanine acetyltransferase [Gordonia hirsuta DSM 44140 = NBRC 16056]